MRKSLWAIFGCVALLGLSAGCGDDDGATCGDGVVSGSEQCDLTDLDGMTCADVVAGSAGTLLCNNDCTFNSTGCTTGAVCGNGIPEFGETCDCGSDPTMLPADCTDVNNGANANCDANCDRIDLCGDGVISGTEDCDCGDPSMISAPATGCTAYNGAANATCDDTCGEIVECQYDLYDECFPLQGDPPAHGCCEDDYGVQLECKTSLFSGMDNMCARGCTTDLECPWNNMCWGVINPAFDLCHYSMCGPGDAVDAQFFGTCQAGGGASAGLCIPFGRYVDTHDTYGFCLETGTIAEGDPCPTSNADPPVYLLGTDRDITGGAASVMCDTGLCLATQGAVEGTCARFCNWQEEYDNIFNGGPAPSLGCAAGYNCWGEVTISQNDVSSNGDYGYRSADLGYCLPTPVTDPTMGDYTCNLLTGELLSDPSQTCADTNTDGRCLLIQYNTTYYDDAGNEVSGTEITHGSLVGRCNDSNATTGEGIWDTCDPATSVCPAGSLCLAENEFGAADGQTRCIPYCDTAIHDGTTASCSDLGAVPTGGATPVCTSLSWLPFYQPGGAADADKTRLGYCALPRP